MRQMRPLALLLVGILLIPQGTSPYGAPQNLEATYSLPQNAVQLSWDPPYSYSFTYRVQRDNTSVGMTTGTTYADPVPSVPPDPGYIYFVGVVWQDGNGVWWSGPPAVIGVSTLACEVLSVSTNWQYPYVYAHLHQECLEGTVVYDKDAVWKVGKA